MIALSMVVRLRPTQCSRLLRLWSAVPGRVTLRRLIGQTLVGSRVQRSLPLAGGFSVVTLLNVLLLIQIPHHIVNCLYRATNVCELALQPNVHDIHVDVHSVVAVVALHVQKLLLAAHAVLLWQSMSLRELILQMTVILSVHRQLCVVTRASWDICARIC